METTVNYTIEQFKESMMNDFKDKLIKAGGSNIALASKVTPESFVFEFYAKDTKELVELDSFTIRIKVG